MNIIASGGLTKVCELGRRASLSIDQISKRTGLTKKTVSNYLCFLRKTDWNVAEARRLMTAAVYASMARSNGGIRTPSAR